MSAAEIDAREYNGDYMFAPLKRGWCRTDGLPICIAAMSEPFPVKAANAGRVLISPESAALIRGLEERDRARLGAGMHYMSLVEGERSPTVYVHNARAVDLCTMIVVGYVWDKHGAHGLTAYAAGGEYTKRLWSCPHEKATIARRTGQQLAVHHHASARISPADLKNMQDLSEWLNVAPACLVERNESVALRKDMAATAYVVTKRMEAEAAQ
jgi:hypothetical protein